MLKTSKSAAAFTTLLLAGCTAPKAAGATESQPQGVAQSPVSFRLSGPKSDTTPERFFHTARAWVSAPGRANLIDISFEQVAPGSVVQVAGQLRELRISDPAWLVAPQSKASNLEPYRDQFGNLISLRKTAGLELLGMKPEVEVKIAVPLSTATSPEGVRPLSFDLRQLGGPLSIGLIEDRALYNLGNEIASALPPAQLKAGTESDLRPLIDGAREIERRSGLSERSLVRSVFIVNSSFLEAGCSEVNPDAFTVSSKALELFNRDPKALHLVARHEAIHLLDRMMNYPSGGEEITTLYKKLKKDHRDFVDAVNEQVWGGVKQGGHAADSPREFFASFMNALDTDAGLRTLRKIDPEITQLCARTLAAAIVGTPHGISPDSDIAKRLAQLAL